MNGIDWNLIRTFVAVADGGSLTVAAETLQLSQPTVGRQISELEAALGLTLFSRGRGGMQLSESGQSLIAEARQVAREAERFAIKAAGNDHSPSGTVRITASEVVAAHLLAPCLPAFREREPAIDLEIVASNATDNLLARDADIAIRMYRPTQTSLVARKIGELSMGLYASETYLNQHASAPGSPAELAGHTLIGFDRDDSILQGMAAFGMQGTPEMFAYRTDNQLVYLELVRAGAGIGFCMDAAAGRMPGLQRLSTGFELPSLPVWLVTHQELRGSVRIRCCMAFLAQELARAADGNADKKRAPKGSSIFD